MPTLFATLRAAEEFGVPPRTAVIQRLNYLMPRIRKLEREVSVFRKRAAKACIKKRRTSFEVIARLDENELVPLQTEAQVLMGYINRKFEAKAKAGSITPEMIARAKTVPIAQLLGQQLKGQKKMVCCPFHVDKEPSASVKNNFLVCFAGCMPKDGKKGWDSISLLMELEGNSFIEAVLALQ